MNCKWFFSLFFLIFINQTVSGINWYQKGDSLFVWAESGLNLRMDKNIKSNIIKTLPYGAKVITLESKWYGEKNDPNFSIQLFGRNSDSTKDQFKLEGKWIRVKHGATEGFVFDAFLSKLPTFEELHFEGTNKNSPKYYESLPQYLKRIDADLSYEETTVIEWEEFKISKWTSKKGIIYKTVSSYGREDSELILSDYSKEEAYLILNQMCNVEMIIKDSLQFAGGLISESSNSILVRINEITHASIYVFGNNALIKITSRD